MYAKENSGQNGQSLLDFVIAKEMMRKRVLDPIVYTRIS